MSEPLSRDSPRRDSPCRDSPSCDSPSRAPRDRASVDRGSPRGDPLSPDEVEALLSLARSEVAEGAVAGAPEPAPLASTPFAEPGGYDFRRPERASEGQGIALAALHEGFARGLGASLSAHLQVDLLVRLVTVDQPTYSEFAMSLPIPTSIHALSCEPLEGTMVLEMRPSILYPMIDRLLGGRGSGAEPLERPFTSIELALVDTILARILRELRGAWESIHEIDFRLSASESNPFLLRVVPPHEPTVLLGFEARMGETAGMMNLCIPISVIEPILPELSRSRGLAAGRSPGSGEPRGPILESIAGAPIELTAVLAETPVSLYDLITLRPGDILDTGLHESSPVALTIQGKRKFRGAAEVRGDRRVIEVRTSAAPSDPHESPPE